MRKFDYREVNLIPRQCIVDSRSECDTTLTFGAHTFNLPIVPANMSSVINPELAEKLAENGNFYIMHRFLTDEQIMTFVKNMNDKKLITSISVGVKDRDKYLIDQLIDNQLNIDYITIDIAHGHAKSVKEMIAYIKSRYSNTFIIAGNVASEQAVVDLQHWGADAIKVGVAPGKACFVDGTKIKTIDGYKNIEDIELGNYVLTHDGTYQEVINTISYESDEKLLNINGVICTEDHEFYIANIEDIKNITDDNYLKYCYFEKAKNIDMLKHEIVSIA